MTDFLLRSVSVLCAAWAVSPVLAAGPRLVCREPAHEFGAVEHTNEVRHTFAIGKEGNAPLEISRVRACCGATAKLGTNTIAPGANTALEVVLSLAGRQGAVQKALYVQSNDPGQSCYQVKLTGTAVSRTGLSPSAVDFGRVESDKPARKDVTVTFRNGSGLRVTNAVSMVGEFAVRLDKAESNMCKVVVETVPPLPMGITSGEVRLLTDDPAQGSMALAVSALVSSDMQVIPREIVVMASSSAPSPITRHVLLSSKDRKPFKILGVEPPEDGIQVKVNAVQPYAYRCELSGIMPFPDLDGKHVVFATDHSTAKSVAVSFRVAP